MDGYICMCCWEPFKNAYTIGILMGVEAGKTEYGPISSFLFLVVIFTSENFFSSYFRVSYVFIRIPIETWFEALEVLYLRDKKKKQPGSCLSFVILLWNRIYIYIYFFFDMKKFRLEEDTSSCKVREYQLQWGFIVKFICCLSIRNI